MKTQIEKNYESIKNVHMSEIIRMKKENFILEIFIASQVGVIIVLSTVLATMIFN